ncbi:MAG: hypothetical protein V4850_08990 [Myxococcota bacterium]
MIDLFIGWPALHTNDMRAYADGNEQQAWSAAGALYADVGFHRVKRMEVLVSAGLGLSSTRYTLDDWHFDAATWTGEADLTARWYAGGDKVRASWEFGLGPHLRVGLPDWSDGRLDLGPGGHTALSVEFGPGPVRPMLQGRLACTIAPGYSSGDITLPEGMFYWSYSPSSVRAVLLVGAAFGAR